jgi:glycosyltransferase involved in cell wall biosynthesis
VDQLEPSTISVVLPCLNESENTVQTVQSFCDRTPPDVLHEIIVVDDGSSPPLEIILRQQIPDRCKLKVLRHTKPYGLMIAKQTGGDAAVGRFIGFYDCHVAPSKTWYIETIKLLEKSDKRMVVPMIGDLNISSWDEKKNGALTAKCYINLGTADFWWYDDDSDWIPIISGGLVATTRKWWQFSGGFDGDMRGWGGENSDQSLTAWLCGGDIVRAKTSTVSHMWRVSGDKRTRAKFHTHFPGVDNMARVAAGWFDEWMPKFRQGSIMNGRTNASTILERRKRMGCKPFAYFLHRFRKIYLDSGMLPSQVFRIRLKEDDRSDDDRCLKRHGRNYHLARCDQGTWFHEANWVPPDFPLAADLAAGVASGGSSSKDGEVTCGGHKAPSCAECPQGNGEGWCHVDCTWVFGQCIEKEPYLRRMAQRKTPKCCSGIREWNALECLDTIDAHGPTAYQCDVTGKNRNQQYIFDNEDRIRHQGGKCLNPDASRGKLVAGDCDKGARWEQIEGFVPEETDLYHEAVRRLGYSEDSPDH